MSKSKGSQPSRSDAPKRTRLEEALTAIPKPHFDYDAFRIWLDTPPCNSFVVEVGCGVGLQPILWAKSNPQSKILAIERTQNKFAKFLGRVTKHPHLKNIFPAHADAATLLPHLKIENKVDTCFVLYPNPYPKSRHKNLRFAYSHLTEALFSYLKSGGKIIFATNLKSYADELRNALPQNLPCQLISDRRINPNDPPRTHFEKKYLARGESCYELIFQKS